MKHTIALNKQPGIQKGHLIWKEDGKIQRLDLAKGPFLLRILNDALVLESEQDAGYTLDSLEIRTFSFLLDEGLYGLYEGQTQIWFGQHGMPDLSQEIMGLHAIGTGDISDNFPSKVPQARQLAVNLSYDASVYLASISSSKEAPFGILFRQASSLFHGLRLIDKPATGLYNPGNATT